MDKIGGLPKVSIIIAAYNAQLTIAETINSVIEQNYKEIEIIVVDDGSTDGTANIVLSYGSRVHYFYQKNSGGCSAPRNNGVKYSQGDVVGFLDADDVLAPDYVQSAIQFLIDNEAVGLVFLDYKNFTSAGVLDNHFSSCPEISRMLQQAKSVIIENACSILLRENFGIACSFLVRRKVFNVVNGFDDELKAGEDFNFYYRVARLAAIGVVNQVGLYRRLHDTNMTKDSLRMYKNLILSQRKLFLTENDSSLKRALSRKLLDYHCGLGWELGAKGDAISSARTYLVAVKWVRNTSNLFAVARGVARAVYIGMFR